jgi:hypothetical protein
VCNQMNGKGKMTWPDGREYDGEFVDGRKSSNGRFNWPDGRYYIGPWKNGLQDGIGNFYFTNGSSKAGEWKVGKLTKWLTGSESQNGTDID